MTGQEFFKHIRTSILQNVLSSRAHTVILQDVYSPDTLRITVYPFVEKSATFVNSEERRIMIEQAGILLAERLNNIQRNLSTLLTSEFREMSIDFEAQYMFAETDKIPDNDLRCYYQHYVIVLSNPQVHNSTSNTGLQLAGKVIDSKILQQGWEVQFTSSLDAGIVHALVLTSDYTEILEFWNIATNERLIRPKVSLHTVRLLNKNNVQLKEFCNKSAT